MLICSRCWSPATFSTSGHAAICSAASVVEQVMTFRTDVDDFHVHGREAYWLCRVSQLETKVNAKKFEKAIGGPATWRNVNTIVRLAKKYSH